jgi:hypothetical protein
MAGREDSEKFEAGKSTSANRCSITSIDKRIIQKTGVEV